MKNIDNEIVSWNKLSIILKHRYPILSEEDLKWKANKTRKQMIEMISSKLGILSRQLI